MHGLARRLGHDRLKRRRRGRALVGRTGQLDAGHLMREAISMPSGRTSEMQSETRGTSCTSSRCNQRHVAPRAQAADAIRDTWHLVHKQQMQSQLPSSGELD